MGLHVALDAHLSLRGISGAHMAYHAQRRTLQERPQQKRAQKAAGPRQQSHLRILRRGSCWYRQVLHLPLGIRQQIPLFDRRVALQLRGQLPAAGLEPGALLGPGPFEALQLRLEARLLRPPG